MSALEPKLNNGNITAVCPDCGVPTTFESKHSGGSLYGSIIIDGTHNFKNISYTKILFSFLRCASCGRGGVAKIHNSDGTGKAIVPSLEEFLPRGVTRANLPNNLPKGLTAEFREAEVCASASAWRAASALLRSTLEKTLKANGYSKGSLATKIDEAAKDGVLTESRRKRAHDEIRVLGNDVLHDEWQPISHNDVEIAMHYTQRILEDFYDDRNSVEAILIAKGRITP